MIQRGSMADFAIYALFGALAFFHSPGWIIAFIIWAII